MFKASHFHRYCYRYTGTNDDGADPRNFPYQFCKTLVDISVKALNLYQEDLKRDAEKNKEVSQVYIIPCQLLILNYNCHRLLT